MIPVQNDIALVHPEMCLAATGLLLLLISAFGGDKAARLALFVSLAGLVAAFGFLTCEIAGQATAFNGLYITDKFATVMKGITLVGALAALGLSSGALKRDELDKPEFATLLTFSVLGMMVMISANDLLSLYIGFELQSLALYVLAAFRRDHLRSSEAGLKYFVLGGLSSGLMLYGISLVYGYSGTTSFSVLATILSPGTQASLGLVIGVVFIAAGLAFKVSAVPFHMWTPDVYEGASTPVTAFFALAPKVAAMALFTRFLYEALGHVPEMWWQILWLLSLSSMVVGSFAAIAQTSIKRLMAYSSIANVGYALIGLTVGTPDGVAAMVIYMGTYVAMTAGAFGIILVMQRGGRPVEQMSDLAGLSRTRPGLALAMMIFMFSFAGIPPLAGFIGKFYIFMAAVHAHFLVLAIVGVLSSVISAYYYLRIIRIMYFDEPGAPLDHTRSWGVSGVVLASTLVTSFLFLRPAILVDQASAAARSLTDIVAR